MKNFVHGGDKLALVAPYAVAAGAGFLVGAIFAVAYSDAANGADVLGATEGVFDLKAAAADTPAQGAVAYWDNTNKQVTTTATSNTKIGVFVVAKAGGATVGTVRLNGAF